MAGLNHDVAASEGKREKWAVFDLDGTLTRHDSMWRFFRHVNGPFGFAWKFLRATPWFAAYVLKLRPSNECKLGAINVFVGTVPAEKLSRKALQFADLLRNDLQPGASDYLKLLKANGFRLALCTASASLWVDDWARRVGFDSVICTELWRGTDGRFSYATPNCKNEEKTLRLREAGIFHEGNYAEAYGDSPLDAHMLRAASRSTLKPDFSTLLSRTDFLHHPSLFPAF